jgi:hypothetical protein
METSKLSPRLLPRMKLKFLLTITEPQVRDKAVSLWAEGSHMALACEGLV